ncbi:hypothetical protein BJX96DRAFT_53805 [Aspergillus floccosus]
MKGLQTGIPLAVLAAVARAQMFEVGGNHGDDNGNGAGLSFDQTHNTEINNAASNKQDASYNWLAKGKFGGPFRRDYPDEDYVGGNYGDDSGNSIGNSHKQGGKTKIGNHSDNEKDDSVNHVSDFDDFLRKRQDASGNHGEDHGNKAILGGDQKVNTEIKNSWKNEENVNVNIVHEKHGKHDEHEKHDKHEEHEKHEDHDEPEDCEEYEKREIGVLKPIRKRFGPGFMVGGNHGDDYGNTLDLSMDQAQNTGINNNYSNKQKTSANAVADADAGPWFKRSHVGGNHGDDRGNDADLSFDQTQNTEVNNDWKNHQKLSENVVGKAKGWPVKRFAPEFFGVGGNHGNDRGNDADLSFDQTQNTEVNNNHSNKQKTSVNALADADVGPWFKRSHVHRDPFHGIIPEGPVSVVGGNHGDDGGDSFGYSGDQTDNHEINNGYSNDQKASYNAAGKADFGPFKRAYRPTTPEELTEEDTVSHAANTPEAACATETREVVQTVTETVYAQLTSSAVASKPSDPIQMAPMATPTSAHIPLSTVVQASTYHMIPVFVPEASAPVSSGAVASSSHVAASSSAAVPTSVDAYRPGAASSQATPSPSHHAGVVFDGAAGHVTPHTGLVSLFCGVLAVLAFVY